MSVGQLLHIRVYRHCLIYGLAHIRDELIDVGEVLIFGSVLIVADHAEHRGGDYRHLAVCPYRLRMLVLFNYKRYEIPRVGLRVIDSAVVIRVYNHLQGIVSVGFFRRIEIHYPNRIPKAFKQFVRIVIKLAFGVVCDNTLARKSKGTDGLYNKTAGFAAARRAYCKRMNVLRDTRQPFTARALVSCKHYAAFFYYPLIYNGFF